MYETFSIAISNTFTWVSSSVTFKDNKLSLSIKCIISYCIFTTYNFKISYPWEANTGLQNQLGVNMEVKVAWRILILYTQYIQNWSHFGQNFYMIMKHSLPINYNVVSNVGNIQCVKGFHCLVRICAWTRTNQQVKDCNVTSPNTCKFSKKPKIL